MQNNVSADRTMDNQIYVRNGEHHKVTQLRR